MSMIPSPTPTYARAASAGPSSAPGAGASRLSRFSAIRLLSGGKNMFLEAFIQGVSRKDIPYTYSAEMRVLASG